MTRRPPADVVAAGASPLIRSSLAQGLRGSPGTGRVLTAASGDQLVAAAAGESCRVVVSTADLTDTALVDVLPAVLACSVRVLVVCARTSVDVVPELLLGGASGFLLLEECTRSELAGAVAATASGGATLHPAVAMMVLQQWRGLRSASAPALTAKETQVLQAMVSGSPVKTIARALGMSQRTVDSHRGRIYTKLGAKNHVQAVARGLELGIVSAG